MLMTPNLWSKTSNWVELNGLVNMSASWLWNPASLSADDSLINHCHCLDACFKPYSDLWSLQTWFSPFRPKPGDKDMYTSSVRSPCKKTLLISNWCKYQPSKEATLIKTQINCDHFCNSMLSIWSYPLDTNLALYLSTVPSANSAWSYIPTCIQWAVYKVVMWLSSKCYWPVKH